MFICRNIYRISVILYLLHLFLQRLLLLIAKEHFLMVILDINLDRKFMLEEK